MTVFGSPRKFSNYVTCGGEYELPTLSKFSTLYRDLDLDNLLPKGHQT